MFVLAALAAGVSHATDIDMTALSAIPGTVSEAYVHMGGNAYFRLTGASTVKLSSSATGVPVSNILWSIPDYSSNILARGAFGLVETSLQSGLASIVIYNPTDNEGSCTVTGSGSTASAICTFAHFHATR